MRVCCRLVMSCLAVVALIALSAPAADETPLLKVVTPGGGNLRVRIPVTPGFPAPMKFDAQVPRAKKSERISIKASFEVLPGQSYVTAKKLESWGYDPGKLKEFTLPELHIPAAQIAPKVTKGGSDVMYKLTNVKLTVINDPASKDDTVHMSDLSISSTTLFQNAMSEPRVSFADKFIEITIPSASVKRPDSDSIPEREVSVSTDAKLVPSVGPSMVRDGRPVFVYASVDGQDSYKTPEGKTQQVNVSVSTISNMPSGVMMTIGLARGVKLDFDPTAKGEAALGVDSKSAFLPGKIKELRLGLMTGSGLKIQKDLVVKDIPVYIDKNMTEGYLLIGQKFIDTYFIDGVTTNTGDGWKLYGRTNPELLFDIKTRKKP